MSAINLDARRLLCPMPVILLQNTVVGLPAGAQVKISCTDVGVLHDIPAWCRIHEHKILSIEQQSHLIVIWVEVGANT